MKKIGEGYYYNVYKIDDLRVLKKIKSRFRIFIYILFSNLLNLRNTVYEYIVVTSSISKLKFDYDNILNLISDKTIIGNPIIIDELSYTQDLVKDLKKINEFSNDDFSKVIIDYTFLIKKLWSYGVSDRIFNFSFNCGYDSFGRLVLVDFNELSFDKNEIVTQIIDMVWLNRASYRGLSSDKKLIFKKIMAEEVSEENLNKYWKEAVGV